jgi:integrase/recombinase XerD
MAKKRLQINWDASRVKLDVKPLLKQYELFLKDQGYRDSTINGYCNLIRVYLKFAKNEKPTIEQALKFRESLINSELKPSSINNYSSSIKLYHKMQDGSDLRLPILKVSNKINFYFTEDEISKLLSSIKNLKHLAAISTLFYCLLRASDLCNLDDSDLDLKTLNLRIRDGKRGKQAILPIPPACGEILGQYLKIRPALEINGRFPLFYTDFGNRWERRILYRTVVYYKIKAGIHKSGGCHMLRHSAASILIKNGCDLMTLKELMRHEHLETTARYLTVLDSTKRSKLEKYLVL